MKAYNQTQFVVFKKIPSSIPTNTKIVRYKTSRILKVLANFSKLHFGIILGHQFLAD